MHDNQIALITGANKGIGLTIAKNLAKHGLTVLVGSRDLANGETAAQGIDGDAHAIQLDVTDLGSITAATARVRQEFGRLDVLVNNAGLSPPTSTTTEGYSPWRKAAGTRFASRCRRAVRRERSPIRTATPFPGKATEMDARPATPKRQLHRRSSRPQRPVFKGHELLR